jgi:xanthine/CO dehydrogenase XdhC/CoxF family maturation factor
MKLDRKTLEDANCWFTVDQVRDPRMTEFKREARYRQAQWREQHELAPGSHRNTKKAIAAGGPSTIRNGSKLAAHDADAGKNFLSDPIRRAVAARLAAPQDYETPYKTRLKSDLLSSMPMCFNMFGELHEDPIRARAVAELLFPEVGHGDVEVVFEWSPGRRDPRHTNDRTAFDVAFIVGAAAPRQIIGVETKYHEHALPEKKPKPEQVHRHAEQRQHYTAIANARPDVFRPGWEQLLGTELEQIWRDHLLLLSMLANGEEWDAGRYLLVYPSRNVSFGEAAQAYAGFLADDDTTFAAVTADHLVEADVLHEAETHKLFPERYLWWM